MSRTDTRVCWAKPKINLFTNKGINVPNISDEHAVIYIHICVYFIAYGRLGREGDAC